MQIDLGKEPGIADEQRAPGPHTAQIFLDPLHLLDVRSVTEKHPRAHRYAIVGHRQADDHLRVVVAAFLAVAALTQRLKAETAPLLIARVLVVAFDTRRWCRRRTPRPA